MNPKQIFEDLSAKLSDTVANSPVKDWEKNAKSMITGALAKMDLVTREEFDVQQQILVKTRLQINQLEEKIAILEKHLQLAQPVEASAETTDSKPVAITDKAKSEE